MEQNGFPLEVLIEKAAQALGSLSQRSARVQERPDVRTIRYYASLGLLDKPLYFQGRTALYGERHVAQLVSIKRLQAEQLSLHEIQKRLLGMSEAALFELARLPREEAARRRHWTSLPLPLREAPLPEVKRLIKIQLSDTVSVLVEGVTHPPTQEQLRKLQEASMALMEQLRALQDDTI